MKFKIVGKRGEIPFEVSSERIEEFIKKHHFSGEIQIIDYLFNDAGDVEGLKCLADLGHGYGFNYGWQEFQLTIGKPYSFKHSFTSIEGSSDWFKGSFNVTVELVKEE